MLDDVNVCVRAHFFLKSFLFTLILDKLYRILTKISSGNNCCRLQNIDFQFINSSRLSEIIRKNKLLGSCRWKNHPYTVQISEKTCLCQLKYKKQKDLH